MNNVKLFSKALASEENPKHSNGMPKNIIRLEKLFNPQDKFKRLTYIKTRSSIVLYEVVNLGTK